MNKHSGSLHSTSSGAGKAACCIVRRSGSGWNLPVGTEQGLKVRPEVWTLFCRYLQGGERALKRGVTESKHCFKKVNLPSAIKVS